MNQIDKMTINEIKNENKFHKKRIWLQKKINSFMLDNTKNNPPLVISRKNILKETFNQFNTNSDLNFYRKLPIYFVDESAYDDGGVEREWYSVLFKEIFSSIFKNFILETSFKDKLSKFKRIEQGNSRFFIFDKFNSIKLGALF